MINPLQFLQKNLWLPILLLATPTFFASGYLTHGYLTREAPTQLNELKKELSAMKSKHEKLEESYKNLEDDRDNVLIQTKRLIQDKNRLTELEDKFSKLSDEHKDGTEKSRRLEAVYHAVKEKNDQLNVQLDEALSQLRDLQSQTKEQLATINDLRRSLETRVEKTPEYKQLKDDHQALKVEKARLEKEWKRSDGAIRKLEKQVDEERVYRQKFEDLQREYEEIEEANKDLLDDLKNTPKKFSGIANENKTLIRETAKMHYNLGNFYAENKRYDRAIQEYKKTLDLDPYDARAHYNLGYIYAEEIHNHERAEYHFRKYLSVDPNDESADWVQNYLVTRGTFDGEVIQ